MRRSRSRSRKDASRWFLVASGTNLATEPAGPAGNGRQTANVPNVRMSSSEPTFDESLPPPEDEDFETAGGGFRPDDEHFIVWADDSDIDDDEEERQELVRQRMEEYLADIRNSTMVQLRMR